MRLIAQDKKFYRQAARLAVPITFQSLITIGVNLTDNLMLGKVSEQALSGATLANEFVNLFQILCMGMGMGASVMTARFYGAGEKAALKKSVTIMYRFCLAFILLFTLAVLLAPEGIMRIYTKEEPIIALGAEYFRWSIPRFLLVGLTLTTTQVMRSTERIRLPLMAAVAAFFLNVVLNYVLIFGKLGAPEMGVAGAALATVLARCVEFGVVVGYFVFKDKRAGYRLKDLWAPCGDLLGEYVRVSIPVLVSDSLLGLGNSVVTMEIGHLGQSFVAANAIANPIRQLSTVVSQGISYSAAILVGNTLGRGSREEASAQGEAFLGLGLILGVLGAVCSVPVGFWLTSSFYELSPQTEAYTRQLLLAMALVIFFQSTNMILTKGVLRGGGDTRYLMVADILFLWVLSIPLGYAAGFWWQLSPFCVYLCMKADQIVKNIIAISRLKSQKWIQGIQVGEREM